MRPLRVLVVDDSAVNRASIAELLEQIDHVEVVGKAADGDEALKLHARLDPDLVTLDLEMPRMDGFSFLRFVMARRPTPVIIVSSHGGKANVSRALEMGALDFVSRPVLPPPNGWASVRDELEGKLTLLRELIPKRLGARKRQGKPTPRPQLAGQPDQLILVAASTGGPGALVDMVRTIERGGPNTLLILQHMPARFTKTFADRLDRLGAVSFAEVSDGMPLLPRHGYVAPGGRMTTVIEVDGVPTFKVEDPSPSDRYVPSADAAMRTAARVFAGRCTAVVMTGMGDDGAAGVRTVHARGGRVLVQSLDSAVVDGMPRAALDTGIADEVLDLEVLQSRVATLFRG